MVYVDSFVNDIPSANYLILSAFKCVLVLLIVLNIVSIFLSKNKTIEKHFLWFIGITYSTVILFSVLIALFISNVIWNYYFC